MFKNRQFKRKKLYFVILISTLIILAAAVFGYKVFTENKLTRFTVDTENLNCASSEDIKNHIQKMNFNYFYFKSADLEYDLRKKFFCIGKIKTELFYPDRLKLNISGREGKFVVSSIDAAFDTNPTIQLSLEQLNATESTSEAFPPKVLNQILDNYKESSGSSMFLVDEAGVVFEEANSNIGFPRLSLFSQDLKIGLRIPNDLVKKVSEVIDRLKEIDTPTENLLVVGDRLIIDSSPRIIFSLNRPLDRQSASLQLILRQAKMNLDPQSADPRSVESIDLRFDRPVVVYSKK